jgi:hypothetical protein
MARHSSLRASDADRDAVAERLRQAAVEGRLEPDELEERLHTALRARTYGDLSTVLSDLPAQPVRWERRQRLAPVAALLAVRLVVTVAILAAVVVFAALTFAWWMIGLIVWLALSCGRRCHGSTWHRPPHVRRMSPRRL